MKSRVLLFLLGLLCGWLTVRTSTADYDLTGSKLDRMIRLLERIEENTR